jgi:hypothetical protein
MWWIGRNVVDWAQQDPIVPRLQAQSSIGFVIICPNQSEEKGQAPLAVGAMEEAEQQLSLSTRLSAVLREAGGSMLNARNSTPQSGYRALYDFKAACSLGSYLGP